MVLKMPRKPTYEELEQRIRELEKNETQFKFSEEQLSEAISQSLISTAIGGSDGSIISFNEALEELIGYRRSEISDVIDWSNKLYPDKEYRDFVSNNIQQDLRGEKQDCAEFTITRKDGSIRTADFYTSFFKDGLIIQMEDITERKLVEEVLRDGEVRYKELFQFSPDPIILHDMDMNVIDANDKAAKEFGYSKEELLEKTIFELHPETELKHSAQMLAVMKKIDMLNVETKFVRKDGSVFLAEATPCKYTLGSKPIIHVAIRDITERKRMEEELLRAQKLESVGLLAGGIAHDFNNILTTIICNIAMDRMQTRPEDKIFELLSEAEMSSTKAQTLTKQLLTFAKGGTPVKETAAVNDILKESSFFVLRGSKSKCEFSIAEDLWPVEVDIGQMSQVINNIVINANQAMPQGGIIQVAAENLIIEDRHGVQVKPGRYIRISIKDQGVGIAQKHFLTVFDPYFTTKQEGSGLGGNVNFFV